MTIQQLKYVLALDQERHFAKAAEVCMVTQPGLTIQLKNLEEEIGIKIFDRNKVPLTPTKLGIEIINRAKKILREADEIRDFVVNEKNSLEGEIKVGIITTLSPYLIPLFINRIKEATPKVHFIIKEANTGQLMNDLETGLLDVAIMATPTGNTNLIEHPIFKEPFMAYLNANHPMAKDDFYEMQPADKAELLLLHSEFCYNAQLLDICGLENPEKIKAQFTYDVSSIETLKNLVRADLGFAIIPELSIVYEKDSRLIKPFKEPVPVREISLVVSDSFSKKLLLEKMNEAIWSSLPDSIKKDFAYRKIRWNDSPYFVKSINSFM
ncbi:LysR substrate-binding domain-containing protein [Flavobacterium sp. Fl-77]|uniref:LysR substrate-binding domain-containing protein n=1 Tax=Flavobacterium flavipigmentatum TaxID=2893884 RepID=A0AAJ2SG50_9FLAO|nr:MULTISPECIES: hydrogen peroxide-inducible genes activator [unclassified Flavobacterium]MDX6182438.1 LysR substrate-binding domain-containing protein [Flavobacterium sp. Fl-33]MDX6185649.1 LysR substrate-binding domain-containing protein [Flavobacterium sp. Fl-77]UFH38834.1 LysR substrate-binding domain-containing protein [Flavobacterium sp. F-70]